MSPLRHAFIVLALAAAALGAGVRAQAPAPADPGLTSATDARLEAHLLRVDNVRLRAALAQVQAELDTVRLAAERAELLEQLRRELGAPADAVFDWQRRRFVPARKDNPTP